ncbi:MAG: hypothetical protein ACR2O8_10150 [Rhizobiaceae bacterium]
MTIVAWLKVGELACVAAIIRLTSPRICGGFDFALSGEQDFCVPDSCSNCGE